jgi:hypothetical protein
MFIDHQRDVSTSTSLINTNANYCQLQKELIAEKISSINFHRLSLNTSQEACDAINSLPPNTISSPFLLHELSSSLKTCKNFSAPGPDCIPYKLIKDAGKQFHLSLLSLFNLSLASGTFPSPWKTAILFPLTKDPTKTTLPSHFRPIALVNTMGKLFEKLINKRLQYHLHTVAPLNNMQFGFRQKRNTTDSLLFLTQHIHSAWDTNFDLLFISFDIEKAFDSVWRDGLYFILHAYGVRGKLLRLIVAWHTFV